MTFAQAKSVLEKHKFVSLADDAGRDALALAIVAASETASEESGAARRTALVALHNANVERDNLRGVVRDLEVALVEGLGIIKLATSTDGS